MNSNIFFLFALLVAFDASTISGRAETNSCEPDSLLTEQIQSRLSARQYSAEEKE